MMEGSGLEAALDIGMGLGDRRLGWVLLLWWPLWRGMDLG